MDYKKLTKIVDAIDAEYKYFLMGFDGAQDTFYTTEGKVVSRAALQGGNFEIQYFDSPDDARLKAEELKKDTGEYFGVVKTYNQ